MAKETITINGKLYDKLTGMPLGDDHTTNSSKPHAQSMHARMHRSKTLSRKHLKQKPTKPTPVEKTVSTPSPKPVGKSMDMVAKKPVQHKITKFAPHPKPAVKSADEAPVAAPKHPVVQKAHQKQADTKAAAVTKIKPSQVLKAEAVDKALHEADAHHQRTGRNKAPKSERRAKHTRRLTFASAAVALLLMGGYFSYLSMPDLSVRVAAARAGIDASYPSYRPSGYSINGPVAYDNGKVQITFGAHGTAQAFTLAQERSGWDSNAVLEDYVAPKAGEDYLVTRDGGLTIYTWKGNAAWVSRGILYTVHGDAPLAPEQLRRIATSM